MGVESDQLVYDYLSRVGDLAQSVLPADQRMRLVARLRSDIDRERGGSGGDSESTVRRILDRLGTPDAVVEAVAGPTPAARTEDAPRPAVPVQRDTGAAPAGAGTKRPVRPWRTAGAARAADTPRAAPADGAVPQPGAGERDTEWWRVGTRRRPRPGDELAGLPGMTGGVLIPMDPSEDDRDDGPEDSGEDPDPEWAARRQAGTGAAGAAYAEEPTAGAAVGGTWWRRLRGRGPAADGGRVRRPLLGGSPLLTLAGLLLVAGAVLGSLVPLGLGWLTAYASRRLSRAEAKFVVLGIPGTAASGMLVWFWGRSDGRWGTPVAQGQMAAAIGDALPAVVRIAAICSALYLLWRSRRLLG